MSSDVFFVIAIGIGGTSIMDVWGVVRGLTFSAPLPNYRLVGRWIAHMAEGRFIHESIAEARPVRGEALIGWMAHYVIGIVFAGALVAVCGTAWCREPTPAPPLALGLATVVAPFLIMQPGMGAGIAASRTTNPTRARVQSLVTHLVFGVGLYVSALVMSWW